MQWRALFEFEYSSIKPQRQGAWILAIYGEGIPERAVRSGEERNRVVKTIQIASIMGNFSPVPIGATLISGAENSTQLSLKGMDVGVFVHNFPHTV